MNDRHGERPDTPADRPAPVITSKARTATWVQTQNFTGDKVDGEPVKYARPVDDPAPTVGSRTDLWEYDTRQTGANPRGGGGTRPNDHE